MAQICDQSPQKRNIDQSNQSLATSFTRRLGIAAPIVQAPIGSACTPELTAAVSQAGGLGTVAATWMSPTELQSFIDQIQQRSDKPFGVNLVLDFDVRHLLSVIADAGVSVVSTFWGDPAPINEWVRSIDALHIHTAGSVREAVLAVDAGVDVIVAQGCEAGGHVRGHTTTMSLVPAIVDAVPEVPVLAAGGIADARGIVAALALGAAGVWIGTRFLATLESGAHHQYQQRVLSAGVDDTCITTCFDGGWPNAKHRVLENNTLLKWLSAGSPPKPHRPDEGEEIVPGHIRYEDTVPVRDMAGTVDDLALYCGQSAGLVTDSEPADHVVRQLVAETVTRVGGVWEA